VRNLTDLEVLALSRLITDDTVDRARESVQPGDYVVPLDLEGIMELTVGTKYNQRSPIRVKPWHIIVRLGRCRGWLVRLGWRFRPSSFR
jgi:hypothetical protein